jgi:hypothetical protein
MYGIVNKGIEELIKARFSEEKWNAILLRSGVGIDFFIGSESYDDDITFKLATAVSEEMNMTIDRVLIEFGKFLSIIFNNCFQKVLSIDFVSIFTLRLINRIIKNAV